MRKYCLACDLKDDENLIKAYEDYHKDVWPEIKDSLKQAGILEMEIYRTGNRLFMIIHADRDFSFERKAELDFSNPIVQRWERLMSEFQKQIPWSGPDVKWVLMNMVFKFKI